MKDKDNKTIPERPQGFDQMVDECIYLAESQNDSELKEGIQYIDMKAREKGITFYDMMYIVLQNSDEKAARFLKGGLHDEED